MGLEPNGENLITMHALRSLILGGLLMGFLSPAFTASAAPAKDHHHVMWTNKKGKPRCCNKGFRERAEQCATRLRSKTVTNVQVMGGKCSAMK